MLFSQKSAQQKRIDLSSALKSNKLLRFPGAFSPLVSMLIEQIGFDGVYISGAVLSNDLGLPDIGLTTLTEVSSRGRAIARVTSLPSIIDIDTGFGEILNVARSIQEMEELGISGCHIEDQVNPKRCGHLDHKNIVDTDVMVKKIKSAAKAKCDTNFIVIARTDARSVEGLDKAIQRAKAYVDAGANVIFPEALENESEFEKFRKEISVPLLANMTEFGKSKLLSYDELKNIGYNIVIYPVTTLRLAMKAVEDGLIHILKEGSQEIILDKMQNRKELYKIIKYKNYNDFDNKIFNFEV
ncbi:MAG: methylisocitrate lyase [Spirochaetota bacterium]|nr:methylisocitrate lyase [Spirochaetota bacterium]